MENNLTKIALAILKDEASGDIKSASEKMDLENYSMTWMYKSKDTLFPSVKGEQVKAAMGEAYEITGRAYEIRNTAESGNVVFIEMIESYPDEKKGKEFRTPITLVLEFSGEKIVRGRHYTDPALSYEHLEKEQIYEALGKIPTERITG